MKVGVRSGLVVAAAAVLASFVLAASGNAAVPAASHRLAHGPDRVLARQLPGALHGVPTGSQAEAAELARRMLSRLRLPAGARRVPSAPLRPGLLWAGAVKALDLHEFFGMPQPMTTVAALLASHVPTGMSLASTSELGDPAGVEEQYVSYTPLRVPTGIYIAQLALSVAPAPGGSIVRADAQVIWYPPRSAAEYIDAARYHVVAITVTVYGTRPRTRSMIVTSRSAIADIAAALNRSPVVPVQEVNCPAIVVYYRLAFAVTRQGRPAVVVYATQQPCLGVRIVVDGRDQPPLQDGGKVAGIASRLAGVPSGLAASLPAGPCVRQQRPGRAPFVHCPLAGSIPAGELGNRVEGIPLDQIRS
jgi:hypothetical protein